VTECRTRPDCPSSRASKPVDRVAIGGRHIQWRLSPLRVGGISEQMAADSFRCGAGRCRTLRARSRPDMQAAVDRSAAGCPAGRCRSVRMPMPPSRVSTVPAACRLRVRGRVRGRTVGPPMSADCAGLARNPEAVHRTGQRGSVHRASGIAARCWPDRRSPPPTRPRPPLSRAGTWRSPPADRPCTPAGNGSGHQPPHTVSTAAAQPGRGRLSRPGCPPQGVPPQPAGHCGRVRGGCGTAAA
jgi:hypothetical protein